MSTIPGESTWADSGLVPPDSTEPRAPRPDLRDEADEGDLLEQAEPVPDDDSEEYPAG